MVHPTFRFEAAPEAALRHSLSGDGFLMLEFLENRERCLPTLVNLDGDLGHYGDTYRPPEVRRRDVQWSSAPLQDAKGQESWLVPHSEQGRLLRPPAFRWVQHVSGLR